MNRAMLKAWAIGLATGVGVVLAYQAGERHAEHYRLLRSAVSWLWEHM